GINNGPADRQPHSYAACLRGVESLENALEMFWMDARPTIADCDEDTLFGFLDADLQLPCPGLNRGHCFNCVQNQVDDDLLQLNTIALHRREPISELGAERNSILADCASHHNNHLTDRLIEVKKLFSRWRLLDVIAHPADDIPGSIRISDDAAERFLCF